MKEDIKEPKIEKEIKDLFIKSFQNQIVVDLGAGRDLTGYSVIKRGRPKAYIAVEYFHYYLLREEMEKRGKYKKDREPSEEPPIALSDEDMLTFLKRLPNNSVSFFASGIDGTIIQDKEYLEEVKKEITRTLDPRGSFVSYASIIFPKGLEEKDGVELMRRRYLKRFQKVKEK